jgi:hypothetical protein
MDAFLNLTILAVATVGALALASAAQWAMLRLAFRSIQPATAVTRHSVVRTELAHGTGQLARAFAGHR